MRACSVYESDSAGSLARPRESGVRQAVRGSTVDAGAVPEFIPKHNSALTDSRAPTVGDVARLEIGDEQVV